MSRKQQLGGRHTVLSQRAEQQKSYGHHTISSYLSWAAACGDGLFCIEARSKGVVSTEGDLIDGCSNAMRVRDHCTVRVDLV